LVCGGGRQAGGGSLSGQRERKRERQAGKESASEWARKTNERNETEWQPLKVLICWLWCCHFLYLPIQSNQIQFPIGPKRRVKKSYGRKALFALSFREQSLAAAGHCCCHRCNAYYYLIRLRLFPSFQFLCRCRFPESGLVGKALLFTDFYRTTTKTTTHTTKCKCNT